MVRRQVIIPEEELPYYGKDVKYVRCADAPDIPSSPMCGNHKTICRMGFDHAQYDSGCYKRHHRYEK